ncbi:MAG TPA: radical SAM protein [Thermodesulfovibrionales bacterium]|nr:radical SAM protein [Thermodesulfovibrionales bacterium]
MAKIAFVQNIAYEYLGLMQLSSVLKKNGHNVDVFIVSHNEDSIIREIEAYNPDLVGFSCTTGGHIWALGFADKLRRILHCKVILGGPHATFSPEVIHESPVDIICRGEGEDALLELADKTDRGSDISDTLNCWVKTKGDIIKNGQRPLIEDLDSLPFPDRELYANKYPYLNTSLKAFMGGRGCPFECTFCFNHAFKKLYEGKGKMVRYRSVANVIAEMQDVLKRYRTRTIYMQDDTLILNKDWVREFCLKYKKEIGLPFVCLIRADLADEMLISMLRDAGCANVFFGIETGSQYLRDRLLKKKVTSDDIVRTAFILHKYGIKFRTYNMVGLPDETLDDAFLTMKLNSDIKTDYPWCSIYQPFPGTDLADYAIEKGLLDCSHPVSGSFFKQSVLKTHSTEFANLQKLFFCGVKFPWLAPLIRKMIGWRPNVLFDAVFILSYAWYYFLSERMTIKDMLSLGVRNLKFFK